MIFHILLWILVIWFIIWIIRGARRHRFHDAWCNDRNCNHPSHGTSALSLLKERYVKGEISKEEFEEKKRVLSE